MREALTQDHLPYIGKLNPGCSSRSLKLELKTSFMCVTDFYVCFAVYVAVLLAFRAQANHIHQRYGKVYFPLFWWWVLSKMRLWKIKHCVDHAVQVSISYNIETCYYASQSKLLWPEPMVLASDQSNHNRKIRAMICLHDSSEIIARTQIFFSCGLASTIFQRIL